MDELDKESSYKFELEAGSQCDSNLIPCTCINWTRKARKKLTRSDNSRTNIYYGIEETNVRLRSFNDLDRYCKSNNIK